MKLGCSFCCVHPIIWLPRTGTADMPSGTGGCMGSEVYRSEQRAMKNVSSVTETTVVAHTDSDGFIRQGDYAPHTANERVVNHH